MNEIGEAVRHSSALWLHITCSKLDGYIYLAEYTSNIRQSTVINNTYRTISQRHDLLTLVAVIGTTIAPWMQFYQQSAVADKQIRVAHLNYERLDTYVGAFFTDFVAFFIVVCTGATLFVHHIQINEAKDAALALGPLVGGNGQIAEILFGIGLLNASIMAASVLPLSKAYSIAEAFGWERGVGRTFKEAPQFLSLYTFIIIIGAGITLFVPRGRLGFLLNLPNVVAGMLLPLILVLMILLCNDRRLMGRYVNGLVLNIIAWITTIVMTVLTLLIVLTTIFPGLFGSS